MFSSWRVCAAWMPCPSLQGRTCSVPQGDEHPPGLNNQRSALATGARGMFSSWRVCAAWMPRPSLQGRTCSVPQGDEHPPGLNNQRSALATGLGAKWVTQYYRLCPIRSR